MSAWDRAEGEIESGEPHRGVQIWVNPEDGVFSAEINRKRVQRRDRYSLVKLIDEALGGKGIDVIITERRDPHFSLGEIVRVDKGRFRLADGRWLGSWKTVYIHSPEAEEKLDWFQTESERLRREREEYLDTLRQIRPTDVKAMKAR